MLASETKDYANRSKNNNNIGQAGEFVFWNNFGAMMGPTYVRQFLSVIESDCTNYNGWDGVVFRVNNNKVFANLVDVKNTQQRKTGKLLYAHDKLPVMLSDFWGHVESTFEVLYAFGVHPHGNNDPSDTFRLIRIKGENKRAYYEKLKEMRILDALKYEVNLAKNYLKTEHELSLCRSKIYKLLEYAQSVLEIEHEEHIGFIPSMQLKLSRTQSRLQLSATIEGLIKCFGAEEYDYEDFRQETLISRKVAPMTLFEVFKESVLIEKSNDPDFDIAGGVSVDIFKGLLKNRNEYTESLINDIFI